MIVGCLEVPKCSLLNLRKSNQIELKLIKTRILLSFPITQSRITEQEGRSREDRTGDEKTEQEREKKEERREERAEKDRK